MSNEIRINIAKNDAFVDCKIKYQCSDYANEIYRHRIVLAKLKYFTGLFKNTKLNYNIENDTVYYLIGINLPFKESVFLSVIDKIYGDEKNIRDKINDEIYELIDCFYYFGASDSIIYEYYDELTDKLIEEKVYDVKKNMIYSFSNMVCISNSLKSAFIARFYYMLNDDDKVQFKNDYYDIFPNVYWKQQTIISGNHGEKNIFTPNVLDISTHSTYNFEDDSTGFWILFKPNIDNHEQYNETKVKITLQIFDGYDIHKHNIHDRSHGRSSNDTLTIMGKNESNVSTAKYGKIIYHKIGQNYEFEFHISVL